MPLQDVGYRACNNERCGPSSTIWVIAWTGIRLAWESRWLRRMVFFAWSPALLFAASFFAFEQAVDEGRLTSLGTAAQRGQNLDGIGMLGTVLADALGGNTDEVDVETTRHLVWSRLLLAIMRAPQALLLAAVVRLVAPTLISRDLRAKAWLIYFTTPVGRTEYSLGKFFILLLWVLVSTMLPALALWLTGVLVSPSVSVAFETWDLPIRIATASFILAVPTVLLALAYSSLPTESRIASFAWFATWVACWIGHGALTTADLVASTQDGGVYSMEGTQEEEASRSPKAKVSPIRRNFRWFARAAGIDAVVDRWAWVSPYHALGAVQAAIFGIDTRPRSWWPSSMTWLVMSASSLCILAWRITGPAAS